MILKGEEKILFDWLIKLINLSLLLFFIIIIQSLKKEKFPSRSVFSVSFFFKNYLLSYKHLSLIEFFFCYNMRFTESIIYKVGLSALLWKNSIARYKNNVEALQNILQKKKISPLFINLHSSLRTNVCQA